MSQDTTSLPQGAGATTASSSSSSPTIGSSTAGASSFHQDEHESGYRASGRAVVLSREAPSRPSASLVVGAAVVGAIAGGAIPFMLSGRSSRPQSRSETAVVRESVTIARPAQELYNFWRDFTNLPQFMDNVRSVTTFGEKRSHWVIKAPAGTSVEFDSRVTEDIPGKLIAWESEPGASVPNRGRVEFNETSSGATLVRATISYDPPAGAAGRLIAKLFQREPGVQARQDLARFKELMEGGGTR